MNKLKISVILVLMLMLCAPCAYAQKTNAKIGYVDLSRLFDEHHKTKEYDKILEAKQKEFETTYKEKLEKIQEAHGKLALLNEDKKAELEKQIEDMKAELLEYDRQERNTLTKERNDKIREILLEIEKLVSDYAEKNGYSIILNDRVLIYGTQNFNVTEDILKVLNENKPEKK